MTSPGQVCRRPLAKHRSATGVVLVNLVVGQAEDAAFLHAIGSRSSMAPKGSSIRDTRGSLANERASATRCFTPSESCEG